MQHRRTGRRIIQRARSEPFLAPTLFSEAGGSVRSNKHKLPVAIKLSRARRRHSGQSLSKDKCPNRMRTNAMKMTAIQAMSMVSAVAMIGFPATAYAGGPPNPAPSPSPSPAPAQNYQFQNSAGNVSCNLSSGGAACEIGNRAYTISTPPPPCAQHSAWGDRFGLTSSGVTMDCHNDNPARAGRAGPRRRADTVFWHLQLHRGALGDEVHRLEQRPLLLYVAWLLPDRLTVRATGNSAAQPMPLT